ncbi:LacI family DNA-binding transcriptional regulator [Fodinicola acaciae]|uniref:LacI family DNA-binding transcriptional regulator n=1 Tax=Fodinicola acaciae TaxID=2681555 RepID=UPI0013D37CD6|nr:LacI family DNA-binding transcriptional regulator [Fodinicola acaciae]
MSTQRKPTRPTLDAVAARAGVSPSTVSRVVRGSTPVSPEVEKLVRAAIAELGYVPNLAARQLVTSRSDTVGLVITEDQKNIFAQPFFAGMIEGLSAELTETPYRLVIMIARSASDRDWLEHYVRSQHVDGVMVIAPPRRDPLARVLLSAGVPVVFMGKPFAARGACFVDADNVGGAKRAVEYLYANGRRRIAAVTGFPNVRHGVDRFTGYQRGLAAVGLAEEPRLIVEADFTNEGGFAATTELIARGAPFDALFAASDLTAQGAIRALRAAKIRVPRDVAVIGFGDEPESARMRPGLTTIAQPTVRMGRELARLMVTVIQNPSVRSKVVVPTELVVRGTT